MRRVVVHDWDAVVPVAGDFGEMVKTFTAGRRDREDELQRGDPMSNDNVALVRDFLGSIDRAITHKDPEVIEKLLGLISDDIRYQNKPQRLIEGKEDFFNWFMEFIACEHMECNVLRAAADGDWVLTQRRDSWTMNGVKVTMDLMGTFEVRDGQIVTWLDYICDREQWEASGQMPDGFFQRWASDAVVYEKV